MLPFCRPEIWEVAFVHSLWLGSARRHGPPLRPQPAHHQGGGNALDLMGQIYEWLYWAGAAVDAVDAVVVSPATLEGV